MTAKEHAEQVRKAGFFGERYQRLNDAVLFLLDRAAANDAREAEVKAMVERAVAPVPPLKLGECTHGKQITESCDECARWCPPRILASSDPDKFVVEWIDDEHYDKACSELRAIIKAEREDERAKVLREVAAHWDQGMLGSYLAKGAVHVTR